MFDRMIELSVNKDYEERIRKTAEENYATAVERANPVQASLWVRLGDVVGNRLVHLGFHLMRRPHTVS